MECILTSDQHKIKDNRLRYTFNKPIYVENKYISLTSMMFYNYFENITDKFKIIIKNKTQSHTINFTNGAYNISDISNIINDEIKNNFSDILENEKYIQIVFDVNRFTILIIVKKDWILELDENFIDLFGFEKNVFDEGYHRSTKISKVNKPTFLKIYCNLVDHRNDSEFLTNVFINNNISDRVIYQNNSIHKRKKIYNGQYYFIDIYIEDEDNNDVIMKAPFQIGVCISS